MLAEGRDINDARGRGGLDQRQQQMRQQEAREIVHSKAQLKTVRALLPLRSIILRTDAGVADKDIETLLLGEYRVRKLSNSGERREIGKVESPLVGRSKTYLIKKSFPTRLVAAMDQDACTLL